MSEEIVRLEVRDPIIAKVLRKFVDRSNVGYEKYKITLDQDPMTLLESFTHLQEELMDAVNYLEKTKAILKKLADEDTET